MKTRNAARRLTSPLSARLAVGAILVAVLLAPFLFELGLGAG